MIIVSTPGTLRKARAMKQHPLLALTLYYILGISFATSGRAQSPDEMPINADGGWFGNGGGNVKEAENPWFLSPDSQPINYCLSVDPTFKINPPAVNQAFNDALKVWRQFFKD